MEKLRFWCIIMLVSVLLAACGQDEPQEVAYPDIRIILAPSAPHQNITKVTVTVFTGFGGSKWTKELDISGRQATGFVSVPIDRQVEIIAEAYEGDEVLYRDSEMIYISAGEKPLPLEFWLGSATPDGEDNINGLPR